MAVETLSVRCWVLGQPAAREAEEAQHWAAEADARRAIRDDHGPETALTQTFRQLNARCWTVTCDGECGAVLDEEENYTFHYETAAEAERDAAAMGWIITRDGQIICPACAPDLEPADLVVTEQMPGQLAMAVDMGYLSLPADIQAAIEDGMRDE